MKTITYEGIEVEIPEDEEFNTTGNGLPVGCLSKSGRYVYTEDGWRSVQMQEEIIKAAREYKFENEVDHPSRYSSMSIEPIDVIESWGLNFSLGCALKYIARLGKKDNPVQELEKAIWYLEREKERVIKNG